MLYNSLNDLINSSSSTRQYFVSLPIEMQMTLHKHDKYIHTAEDLHRAVAVMENYEHHCKLGHWDSF